MSLHRRILGGTILLLTPLCIPVLSSAQPIPDVRFAILRLDFQSYEIKGFYELTAPMRKSLPGPGFEEEGEILWHYQPPGDFGSIELVSRLTGKQIVFAETIWSGRGRFLYPPAHQFRTDFRHGFTHPAPDRIIQHGFFGDPSGDAQHAWDTVFDTDVVDRIAQHGRYEVFLYAHFYTVGITDPTTAEWIVVVFNRPEAPPDMGFIDMIWPRTLMVEDVPVAPEITIHNFGEAATDVTIDLAVVASGTTIGESSQTVNMEADASRQVTFDEITDMGHTAVELEFRFAAPGGGAWSDAYPDNDVWQQAIAVTRRPVFRRRAPVVRWPVPLDFDGDGDVDIVGADLALRLWQNDGHGRFTDITSRSDLNGPLHPRYAVAEDFNGDAYPDLVVVYYQQSPELLLGDGTGVFRDATSGSGLEAVPGLWYVAALDKDNDGDMDLVFNGGQETIMENDGTGFFTDVTATTGVVSPSQTLHIEVADLNRDGASDLVLTNWGSSDDAQVFINDGKGTFTLHNQPWGIPYGRESCVFDYDGDGRRDILFVRNAPMGRSLLFRNRGNLVYEEATQAVIPNAFDVDAADLNDDGYPELVFGNGTLLMNEKGVFVDASDLLVDLDVESWALGEGEVRFVDIDGDGDIDIYAPQAIYINQSRSGEAPGPDPEPKPTPIAPFSLEQNYPNPFNPETQIRYSIEARTHVTLRVYNVAGQLVKTLVDEVQSPVAGGFLVGWDGVNDNGERAASGIYFYRLRANEHDLTRKMIVLR